MKEHWCGIFACLRQKLFDSNQTTHKKYLKKTAILDSLYPLAAPENLILIVSEQEFIVQDKKHQKNFIDWEE